MKLEDYVEKIRLKVEDAVRNTLDRCGVTADNNSYSGNEVSGIVIGNVEQLIESIKTEKRDWKDCYDEIVDDYAFTLFNRLICMKVLESHGLYPEMITQRQQHSGKAYGHYMWLENNSEYTNDSFEGLSKYIEWQFGQLALECDLFNTFIPFHMIPTSTFLKEIIALINSVDLDNQIAKDLWKQGNILSQIYEIYNNSKKIVLKASGSKVEYNKVHVQSQIYTPEWVVKFLVDNSLGKLYLEMYPDSEIKETYRIIGDFATATRDIKPLDEVKVIDPCVGSGNFLLYCFDILYDMYMDQIRNYGADYLEREIPQLIIEKNLHGIDLDERAVQLTKVGLLIKAKTKRSSVHITHYNIVSASFRLPAFLEIGTLFDSKFFSKDFSDLLSDVWTDLQKAYKFGSLLRIDEKFEDKKKELKEDLGDEQLSLFTYEKAVEFDLFENNFYEKLSEAVGLYAVDEQKKFLASETSEAMTYLKIMTSKYDVVTTNPPYLESDQFGEDIRQFLIDNYIIDGCKYNADLYDAFFIKNFKFLTVNGYLAMVQPQSYMHVVSYYDLRKKILSQKHIEVLVDCKFSVFPKVLVEVAMNIFMNGKKQDDSVFIRLENPISDENKIDSTSIYHINQAYFLQISNYPLTYWIRSKRAADLLQVQSTILTHMTFCNGIQTGGNNEEFFRYYWEIDADDISYDYQTDAKKWVPLNKGGDYRKWYGNQNLVCFWKDNGKKLREQRKHNKKIRITSEEHYFKEGLSFTGASSKGFSVRYQPKNFIFEIAGKSVFMKDGALKENLGYLNSRLCSYFLYAINPTVNFQTGNLEVVPYLEGKEENKEVIRELVDRCIFWRKYLCRYNLVERDFITSPIFEYPGNTIDQKIVNYLYESHMIEVLISIYEDRIDHIIFEDYGIPKEEIDFILEQEGKYRINLWDEKIKKELCKLLISDTKFNIDIRLLDWCFTNESYNDKWIDDKCLSDEINTLEGKTFAESEKCFVIKDFIFEVIRIILNTSDDGMIENKKIKEAFDSFFEQEQISIKNVSEEIKSILGKSLESYLETNFFEDLSSRCNVYPRMARAPFIWHISSGPDGTLELFVSSNKWNRDKLYTIKTKYLSALRDKLMFRKSQIAARTTAQSIDESELIDRQLKELETVRNRIDELISSGYNPVLDDGICKNIAPLQDKHLLKTDVLNANQLKKYLKVEW